MSPKPVCFAGDRDDKLHPIDEKSFLVFAAAMYRRYARLPPGRHFEFVGSREKGGNQRIDGHFIERSYPLQDDWEESLDSRVTISLEVSSPPGPE